MKVLGGTDILPSPLAGEGLGESNCVPSQVFLGAFCMLWIPRNTRFDYGVHDRQHLVHASDQRDFFEFSVSKQTFIKGLDDGVVTYGT